MTQAVVTPDYEHAKCLWTLKFNTSIFDEYVGQSSPHLNSVMQLNLHERKVSCYAPSDTEWIQNMKYVNKNYSSVLVKKELKLLLE